MPDQATPCIVLTQGQRAALVEHMGALTLEAVCSTARARELEAENETLRATVTHARSDAQEWARRHDVATKEVQRQLGLAQLARETIKELQDVIAGNTRGPARQSRSKPKDAA